MDKINRNMSSAPVGVLWKCC